MPKLLMVCDHPSLHRGFATVGRHVARGLHASGRWRVQVIGRYPPADAPPSEPYDVFDVDADHDCGEDGPRRFRECLRATLAGEPGPTLLLSIGTSLDQRAVLDRLAETGLRSRVCLIAYMPVNYAPLPPAAAGLLGEFDVVVPFTTFARRAFAGARRAARSPALPAPIPHGVDLDTFRSPDGAERRLVRRLRFGLDDQAFLIGFFGRNTAHKRPDLALRIFRVFALGAWSRCEECQGLTPWALDPIDLSPAVSPACVRCGSPRLTAGTPNEHAHLYLHSEQLTREQRAWSGGWDLAYLAERSGVGDRVHIAPCLRVGEGVSVAELAARMGACDAHLLPFEGGGWELTILETGACGVANVVTDAGAPPAYAAPFSMLVPAAAQVLGATGMRAFIDEGRAVDALVRLAGDRALRERLGRQGQATAAAYAWPPVIQAWDRLLGRAARAAGIG